MINDHLIGCGLEEEFQRDIESFIENYVNRSPEFSQAINNLTPDNFEEILERATRLEDFRLLSAAAHRHSSISGAQSAAIYKSWSSRALALAESSGHPLELIAIMSLSPFGERAFVTSINRAAALLSQKQYSEAIVRKVIGRAVYFSQMTPGAAEALLKSLI